MHQKRLSAKESHPIKKKIKNRFVICPRPGPHRKDYSIPLAALLRDVIGYCENTREAKGIIKEGKIMVDGKVRKDHKYPVGIFDVVSIPDIKESYVLTQGEKWLGVSKPDKENMKICRIENKRKVAGGKTQLNLHDGKNILVDKDDYNTGDSLMLDIPGLKIKKHIQRKKGSLCLIFKGSNKGKVGKLKEIKKSIGSRPNQVSIEINQKTVDIPEKFIFVIGEKTPEIKLGE